MLPSGCGGRTQKNREVTDHICPSLSTRTGCIRSIPPLLRSAWLMFRSLDGEGRCYGPVAREFTDRRLILALMFREYAVNHPRAVTQSSVSSPPMPMHKSEYIVKFCLIGRKSGELSSCRTKIDGNLLEDGGVATSAAPASRI